MIYNNIGGEIEFKKEKYFQYLTDSGRSSLRLIIHSLKKKKFLVPNFICKTVIDIFKENKIQFEYYKIDKNFNSPMIPIKKFDVLYVVNYFGQINKISKKFTDKIIVEDNVFFSDFNNNHKIKQWIGFNSLRKISPLVDGSIIKSSIRLQKKLIKNLESRSVSIKSKGLIIKYNSLNFKIKKNYLKVLKSGENLLDKQKKIYKFSNQSIFHYFYFLKNFYKEQKIRKKNFYFLKKKLYKSKVDIKPIFFSFFPFLLPNKNQFISNLRNKKIYLPSFWPKFNSINNDLYDTLVCIPLDSRYNIKHMKKIVKYVLEHLKKNEK